MRRSASSRGCSLTTSTATSCVRGPKRPRPPPPPPPVGRRRSDDLQRHAARFALFEAAHGQVAEHQAVAGRGVLVRERTFHFEPLEGDARHAVRLRQRVDVLLLAAVDAGAEQAHRRRSGWLRSELSRTSTSWTEGSGVKSNAASGRDWPELWAYTPMGSLRRPGQTSSGLGRW